MVEACKRLKACGCPRLCGLALTPSQVRKIVMSSSPSTRFDGNDICGKAADELPIRPPGQFLQAYAETKALGEVLRIAPRHHLSCAHGARRWRAGRRTTATRC